MRRHTLINAAEIVLNDLEVTGINDIVATIMDRARESQRSNGSKERVKISLLPFQKYSIRVATYDDAAKKLLEIFGLAPLSDPEFWLAASAGDIDEIISPLYEVRHSLGVTNKFLPQMLKLLRQDRLEAVRTSDPKAPDFLQGKALLTVILPETDEQYSSPARLSFALDAIAGFYHVLATLLDMSDSDLSVISCDSGSDKSFDFTGMPQVIQGIRETITAIWDRIVMHRHQQIRASIETIAMSLPVIERISMMQEAGSLAPEQAEILRRKTLSACTKFYDAGAITSDLDLQPNISPRTLMAPEQKLLAAPTNHLDETSHVGASVDLNDEVPPHSTNAELLKVIEDLQRRVEMAEKMTGGTPQKPRATSKRAKPTTKS